LLPRPHRAGLPAACPTLLAVLISAAFALAPTWAAAAPSRAQVAYERADRQVVKVAKQIATCERRAKKADTCRTLENRLQRAGRRLSAAERKLGRSARSSRATRRAPALSFSGDSLRWRKVGKQSTYIVVRSVAGSADRYEVVRGTKATPEALSGKTASFRVRTAVVGSSWSSPVKITWTPASRGNGNGSGSKDNGGSKGNGGNNGSGKGGGSSTAPSDPTLPQPKPADGALATGIVTGSAVQWELPFAQTLGARRARMEFDISTPVAAMAPAVEAYMQAGIKPLLLAGFHGRMPTADEARNLAEWAKAFGPGGTLRAGKGYAPETAVTHIEFGNESNQNWQYPALANDPNWAKTDTYKNLAATYAQRFRDAALAIKAANPQVGLLAIGDTPGRWTTWHDAAFAAVPEMRTLAAGWTVHPYGPQSRWQPNFDDALLQLKKHGVSDDAPIFVTEYGLATDDGRCLSDNYGWDKCMTYAQAADALTSTVAQMRARYGARLAEFYIYQGRDQRASGQSGDREHYFGALRSDRSPKGAYTTAVQMLLAGA